MATFAPHVERAVLEINKRFPKLGDGGTYPGHGEDPPGEKYAADFWSTDKEVHDEAFPWLRANARRLGIKYIISRKRIWSVARASEGVRNYTRYDNLANPNDSQLHKNHIHISFEADAPPSSPQPQKTGVPLMADAVPIQINYSEDQPLAKDTVRYVRINAEGHTSVVSGDSPGIDCEAAVVVEGLKEGEYVKIWWRRIWKKTGAEDQVKTGDIEAVAVQIVDRATLTARFADKLSKADSGWTACLRLAYLTNSATAKITRRTFNGWRLP